MDTSSPDAGLPNVERGETGDAVCPAAVRAELETVLAAKHLRDSPLLRRFLRYSVERTLAGDGSELNECRLAVDVFDRDTSYDPRVDPVVRVTARRLRQKLQDYYDRDGRQDPLRIEIPKGGYLAAFRAMAPAAEDPPPVQVPESLPATAGATAAKAHIHRGWRWSAGIVSACLIAAIGYLGHDLRLRRSSAGENTGRILLAVMPFTNQSGDSTDEYLSDGITEEIIAQLGSLEPARLGVIARGSIVGYKSTRKPVDEIGRELGVEYILEGSVRRAGSRARVTAELVQVSDRTHVWSQSYDEDNGDTLRLADRIGEAAARAVNGRLHPLAALAARPAGRQRANEPATDPEAHELYLRGRYFWSRRSDPDILKGLDYFRRAVLKDPAYAEAYVGIAEAYAMLAANDQAPADEVVPKAHEAAQRALDLDPGLAEAHAVLAHIKFFYDWDFAAAEAEYRRALDLNSGSAEAHHLFGVMLMWIGRLGEASEQLREAQVLDPLSTANAAALGLAYLFAGRDDLAIQQANKALETAPDTANPHELLGFCYERSNQFPAAERELSRAVELAHRDPESLGWLGWVLARHGEHAEAEKIIAELQHPPGRSFTTAYHIAMIHAGLGDTERAIAYLDQAVANREADALALKMEFAWQPLRSDARFKALLRRSGLPVD